MMLLKRNQIDDHKWNSCIENSFNPRIYGLTWYLDSVCDDWLGIIGQNYDFVFPVPIYKKWSLFPWIGQPPFCQQLGIFSHQPIDYQSIFNKLKGYPKIQLNFMPSPFLKYLPTKRNSLLYLENNYELLSSQYSTLRKRELKKAKKNNFVCFCNHDIEKSLDFWVSQWQKKSFYHKKWNKILINLVQNSKNYNRLHFISVYKENKMVGVGLFIEDFERIIYLGGTFIENNSNSMIFDYIIKKFANKIKYLDFEGSSLPGVQQFYESWGKLEYEYYHIWNFKILPF